MSEIDRAIADLKAMYCKAQKNEHIYNPMAYALYKVWRKYDSKNKKVAADASKR